MIIETNASGGFAIIKENLAKCEREVIQQSIPNILEKNAKVVKNSAEIMKNPSKNGLKSMKNSQESILGSFWGVVGAKSRAGRLFVALGRSPGNPFGAHWAEQVAPRVVFGTPRNTKVAPKSHF